MKKYKRKTPLLSPIKMTFVALCAAAVTAAVAVTNTDNQLLIILCGGITAVLIINDLLITIGAGGKYSYFEKYIKISSTLLPSKKIVYSSVCAVVISNASYNNGYGYGINGNIPMQYRVKRDDGCRNITYPFITLHKPQYPIDKIKKGMSSRDLFVINSDKIYCLGICWDDSFNELLKHAECPVYILEDVYLRFKEQFDNAFCAHKENINRFYIVTDNIVAYRMYTMV